MTDKAVLALENGDVFKGVSIGAPGSATGEVVFNTSITGYQEILTDPSYAQQIITLTHPHIGNTGINQQDMESRGVWSSGLVVRDVPSAASNWRQQMSLPEFLRGESVVGIAEIDTRRLTTVLRDQGAQNGCILAGEGELDVDQALADAKAFPGLVGMDLAKEVTTADVYAWTDGVWRIDGTYPEVTDPSFHVVAYDFGVKRNILRILVEHGCRLTVVPAKTTAADVMALEPDGVFLSNGPGDPEPCTYAIESIRELLTTGVPIFGICLGLQLLALAAGLQTRKMPHGHHGANHPVRNEQDGTVLITSQNHGFCVDEASLNDTIHVTHVSLFDQTIQGFALRDQPAFGFQGHPEASPGPHDAAPLFAHFIDLMTAYRS